MKTNQSVTKLLLCSVISLFGILPANVLAQANNDPLGQLMPWAPPLDSNFFSETIFHYDLINQVTDSVQINRDFLIPDIKMDGFKPDDMAETMIEENGDRMFGSLSSAYSNPNFPNYPYSAIVRIELYGYNINTGQYNVLLGHCSGAFINKNTVLSAAHCVHTPPTVYSHIGIMIYW